MDIALKRRLVGASVLVALGVIFIPMLLDGSTEPGRREVAVDLPDEPSRELRRIPITPPPRNQTAAPSSETQSLPREPVRVERVAPVTTEPPQDLAPADTAPDSPSDPVADPVESVVIEQPTAITATESAEPSSAPVQISEQPTARLGSGWVLQLGSFGNAANASNLTERVSGAGYNAYQESIAVGGRTLHRVRIGHWAAKADAAAAGTRLSQRFNDLKPELKWDDTDGTPAPAQPLRGFMVQVGAFGQRANAQGLRDQLRDQGYPAHVIPTGSRFRVMVGPELDRAKAESLQTALKNELSLAGIVVSHP